MNPAAQIMCLRQGDRSIEEYIMDFVELAHWAFFDELCLMIFFRGGLSEPFSSLMPLHHPSWSMKHYIDMALQLSGSTFSVSLASAESESLHVMPAKSESLHVMPAKPESLHFSPAEPELHISPAKSETLPVSSANPETVHVTSADPETLQVIACRLCHDSRLCSPVLSSDVTFEPRRRSLCREKMGVPDEAAIRGLCC
ncbi:hypothetical protein PO909_009926 [Leuciscus waleckii]